MLRDDWSDPGFWRWWWRSRVPTEVKIGAGAAAALVMAVVGYVLAYGIASDAEASGTRVVETTVSRVVTVRAGGRTERRTVPGVQIVRIAGDPVVQTRREVVLDTVTTPGGERVVATTVERRVVTGDGGTVTVVRTVTDRRTVTEQRTVVQAQTVTAPPITQVVTQTVTTTVPISLPVTITFPDVLP